jgi:hypothetical protein
MTSLDWVWNAEMNNIRFSITPIWGVDPVTDLEAINYQIHVTEAVYNPVDVTIDLWPSTDDCYDTVASIFNSERDLYDDVIKFNPTTIILHFEGLPDDVIENVHVVGDLLAIRLFVESQL